MSNQKIGPLPTEAKEDAKTETQQTNLPWYKYSPKRYFQDGQTPKTVRVAVGFLFGLTLLSCVFLPFLILALMFSGGLPKRTAILYSAISLILCIPFNLITAGTALVLIAGPTHPPYFESNLPVSGITTNRVFALKGKLFGQSPYLKIGQSTVSSKRGAYSSNLTLLPGRNNLVFECGGVFTNVPYVSKRTNYLDLVSEEVYFQHELHRAQKLKLEGELDSATSALEAISNRLNVREELKAIDYLKAEKERQRALKLKSEGRLAEAEMTLELIKDHIDVKSDLAALRFQKLTNDLDSRESKEFFVDNYLKTRIDIQQLSPSSLKQKVVVWVDNTSTYAAFTGWLTVSFEDNSGKDLGGDQIKWKGVAPMSSAWAIIWIDPNSVGTVHWTPVWDKKNVTLERQVR